MGRGGAAPLRRDGGGELSSSARDLAAARRSLEREWRERAGARAAGEHPPSQRPNRVFLPGLRARPWWDPQEFSWATAVEARWREVRDEALSLAAQGYLKPREAADLGPARRGDDALVDGDRGGWQLFRLWYRGVELPANTALCPRTSALVSSLPGYAGTAAFGVLLPGTHLEAHCGLSNARLRCHLGLVVPRGCELRVGEQRRAWEEGRCLLFDDSFEHEVWHRGEGVRYVLLFDVWHPELEEADLRWLLERDAFPTEKLSSLHADTRWAPRA